MKKILALLMCFAFAGAAEAETANFDQGLKGSNILKDSQNKSYAFPNSIIPFDSSDGYTEDCARFSFRPSDALLSKEVKLRSEEHSQDCYIVNEKGPNGTVIPMEICDDTYGEVWNKTVRMEIMDRELFPWEDETFNICLNGPGLTMHFTQASYKYDVKQTEQDGKAFFVLTPKEKKVLRPDKNGINFIDLKYNQDSGAYVLTLKDSWAKEYAGERVLLKADLYHDKTLWGDSHEGAGEVTLNIAGEYEVLIPANEVKKAYVKWGFKRIGKISIREFIDKGETPRVEK